MEAGGVSAFSLSPPLSPLLFLLPPLRVDPYFLRVQEPFEHLIINFLCHLIIIIVSCVCLCRCRGLCVRVVRWTWRHVEGLPPSTSSRRPYPCCHHYCANSYAGTQHTQSTHTMRSRERERESSTTCAPLGMSSLIQPPDVV